LLIRTTRLPQSTLELVLLRAARGTGCERFWRERVLAALDHGVTPRQVAAVERGTLNAACLSLAERAALAAAGELVETSQLSEATLISVLDHFSTAELIELVAITCSMVAWRGSCCSSGRQKRRGSTR
jgi:alkylhydroperoxidase family enzyme